MRKARGFTMVEILVALTVTAIALGAAIVASNAQERAYYSGNRVRAAQNSARGALLYLEQKVALAGYGMDAPLALDFGWYTPAAALCPIAAADGGCARDSTTNSDELIFYARNPAFWVDRDAPETGTPKGRAWKLGGIDTASPSVTIQAPAGAVFRRGQILQVVCSGELRYAYFTLAETKTADATGATIQLMAEDAADPFRRQDVAAALSCVTPAVKDSAKVFEINRFRFHVRPVAIGARTDPYLVLDTGTDTDGDLDIDLQDEYLIAEGIESLQVGYVFAEPSIAVVGSTSGAALDIQPGTTAPDATTANRVVRTEFPGTVPAGTFEYEPSSFYKHSLVILPAARRTNAQANIRRVLISIVARSPEPDATGPSNLGWTAGSPLFRLNQDTAPAWITDAIVGGNDGYQRAFADTGVNLPNMTARTMTYF